MITLAIGPLLVMATQAAEGALEPDALVRSLARPAPAAIGFQEVRFSALLEHPLIVAGELRYADSTSLDRIVTTPYREHTAIRGESVRIERDGERPRTFALKRAPELRGLLSAFAGLLSGDPSAIRRTFAVSASGKRDAWQLELTPNDARARQRLTTLTMVGSNDTPHCLSLHTADGASSVMLLGALAQDAIAPTITAAQLQARCADAPAQ